VKLLDSVINLFYPAWVADRYIFDASTQHHVLQMERRLEPVVDSAAGRAIPMMAILDEPGTYVAIGTEVLLPAAKPDGTLNT
jgi:hypothetical protein